jgi:glycosyltransferase involved in cell wall biosynthesis
MPPTSSAREGGASSWKDSESDVTVLVKTFERPDSLRRLVASIRQLYQRMPIVVVDDSREPLDPLPETISDYVHAPYNSLGAAGGRNLGLTRVETPYVLFSDDDMVFERRTDVGRMLFALETSPFDVVSSVWLDFDPWKGICRGPRRFEGTLDIEDGVLVHRLGVTRGTADGLPVYDIVHQFFVASVGRLGPDPWDAELNLSEHYELFLSLGERGLRSTRLSDVVVEHRQERPPGYQEIREANQADKGRWLAKRGLEGVRVEGDLFRPSDRIRYGLPSAAAYNVRRTARVGRRLVSEGRLRA